MKAPKKGAGGLVRVQFFRDKEVIRTHEVEGNTITIGSSPECTIRAGGHASVAARHVTIYVEEKTLTLVPEPGTAVEINGKAVDFAFPRPKDIITAGRLSFSVELIETKKSKAKASGKSDDSSSSKANKRKKPPWFVSILKGKKDTGDDGDGKDKKREKGGADHGGSDRADKPFEEEKPTRVMSWEEGLPNWTASIGDDLLEAPSEKDFNDETVQKESDIEELARLTASSDDEKSESSGKSDPPEDLEDTEPPTAVAARNYQLAVEPTKVGPEPSPSKYPSKPNPSKFRNNQPTRVGPNPSRPPEPTRVGPSPSKSPKNQPTRVGPKPEGSQESEVSSSARKVKETSNTEPVPMSALRGEPPKAEYYFSDNEYDEEHFVEPFSLSDELTPKPVPRKGLREPDISANVVRVFRGQVAEIFGVLSGKPYCSFSRELRCRVSKNKIKLRVHPRVRGKLRAQGRSIVLGVGQKNFRNVVLLEGDSAVFTGAEGVYNVTVFPPPAFPVDSNADKRQYLFSLVALFCLALALHVFAALGVFHYYPPVLIETHHEQPEDIFAEVTVGDWDKTILPPKIEAHNEGIDPGDVLSLSEKIPRISQETVLELLGKSIKGHSKKDAKAAPKEAEDAASDELVSKDTKDKEKEGAGEVSESAAAKKGADSKTSKPTRLGKVTWKASRTRIRGKLGKKQVAAVVDADSSAIQKCYLQALVKKPDLAGRVVFAWSVKSNGRVGAVGVRSSTLRRAKVVNCVSRRIRSWRFPRPQKGSAMVTFTFVFESTGS